VGSEPYLEDRIKEELRKRGYEVFKSFVSKDGLSSEDVDRVLSVSLFEPKRATWFKLSAAPSGWKAEPKRRLTKLTDLSSSDSGVVLIVQSSEPLKVPLGECVLDLRIGASERCEWIRKMSEERKLNWDETRIRRLESTGLELLFIKNWAEQCQLGGAAFENSLGDLIPPMDDDSRAFKWVDALLNNQVAEAHVLWRELKSESEAIPLVALAAKSYRILINLSLGFETPGEAPFLVQKARAVLQRGTRPETIARNIESLAQMDLMLKSSSVSEDALFSVLNRPQLKSY
jgi:DNA polymerase III delta subunit